MALSGCAGLFFYPDREIRRTPMEIGLEFSEVSLRSKDGVSLACWRLAAEGRSKGTVLFLHGNAENISTHIGSVYWLPSAGYEVFLLEYRGYGGSEGTPSFRGAMRDIHAALEYLSDGQKDGPRELIVLGQSIGGSLGIAAVARSEYRGRIRAMVIDSAFSSYRGIVRDKLAQFWLTSLLRYPLSWLFSDRYAPVSHIAKLAPIPLLIVHGTDDPIVPSHHGEALYERAETPKELWLVEGAHHIQTFAEPERRKALLEFFERSADFWESGKSAL